MKKIFTISLLLIALNSFGVPIFAMKKQAFFLDLKKVTDTGDDKDEGTAFVLSFCKACGESDAEAIKRLLTNNLLIDLLYDSRAVGAFCNAIENNRLSVVTMILNSEEASTSLIKKGAAFSEYFKSALQVIDKPQYSDMATMLLKNTHIRIWLKESMRAEKDHFLGEMVFG